MIKSLKDYKDLKKIKLVHNDLIDIREQLTTSITKLEKFKHYIPVMEAISALHNSRTLIEIHLNKYNRILEKK